MAKKDTDWKAEAKRLKEKLGKVKKKLAAAVPAMPTVQVKKAHAVSPLAPAGFPDLPVIAGVEFATAEAGVRYKGRTDVLLVRLAPGTALAGVFTRSATRSAAVFDCQAKLKGAPESSEGAAIVVNSGNANAFTGAAGATSVAEVAAAAARVLGVPEARVLTSSTGVIGEPLPHDRITAVMGDLAETLDPGGIAAAARAIMTTDTFPKGAMAEIEGEGGPIRIAGIVKGSGMIAPDMATMLGYIFTDAAIAPKTLQKMVDRLTVETFNAITVDSDTSTSDTVIVAATGQGTAAPITNLRSKSARSFEAGLAAVMRDLALQVVRDGEGATKLIEIRVTGAVDDADAHRIGMAIANSPLVKTAIAGEDANWGRIVMAVGKSGGQADRDRLSIRFGDIVVAENGRRAPGYSEDETSAYMKNAELVIGVDLGLGKGARTVWTCDLTHGYIDINADYRS